MPLAVLGGADVLAGRGHGHHHCRHEYQYLQVGFIVLVGLASKTRSLLSNFPRAKARRAVDV
jgi:hypothetical protein